MNNNLKLYNELKSVPNNFLKTIGAGRLKGMSDIKPQWRIQKLTEVFGACGFGWKIQNLKFDYKNVGEETVVNCYLEFLYKNEDGLWSEPIIGVGGSNFSTFENKTNYQTQQKEKILYVSDEAEKMAYTDAISVATKMIGLASDIYMGYGGKYDKTPEQEPTETPKQKPTETPKQKPTLILFNQNGDKTKMFLSLEGKINNGEKITLDKIKSDMIVSEIVEAQLKDNFNFK